MAPVIFMDQYWGTKSGIFHGWGIFIVIHLSILEMSGNGSNEKVNNLKYLPVFNIGVMRHLHVLLYLKAARSKQRL